MQTNQSIPAPLKGTLYYQAFPKIMFQAESPTAFLDLLLERCIGCVDRKFKVVISTPEIFAYWIMKYPQIFMPSRLQSNLLILPNAIHLEIMEKNPQELSYGAKAVGLSFNPGNDSDVDHQKNLFAAIIDDLNNKRNQTEDSEKKRLYSIAITEAQGALMWAVKAITWK
jgi:hypothetical protein